MTETKGVFLLSAFQTPGRNQKKEVSAFGGPVAREDEEKKKDAAGRVATDYREGPVRVCAIEEPPAGTASLQRRSSHDK